jgi:uncharacterized protein YcbX
MVNVDELNFYPLKSARGIALASARVASTGFEWDRHWMVIDARHRFLTQRTHPLLARIETEITGTALVLRAPGFAPLALPLEARGETVSVTIWKDECPGLDQGEEASAWISAVLAEPLRIVRVPAVPARWANPEYAGPTPAPVAFPDAYPILVCNRASLDDLNARMPTPLPMQRFRPNIVLSGLPAFAEDRISSLRIGELSLRLVKPSTRCVITATDQRTGERSTDPLPVLKTFRFDRALLGVTFGENAVVASGAGARIERGAECHVTYDS